ncbi:MAG: DUF427 domain-containing protein [Alphaproteobacteria bacterium]|nr:DUF427 domain-containing protein [Alphaproteobacteria bacterium]
MAKATWNGVTIAESDDIAVVEGNAYFPLSAVNPEYLAEDRETRPTYCHWKGIATYFNVTVGGETNAGAAWHYAAPYPQSAVIRDRVAFWNGVEVTGAPEGDGLVEGEPRLDGKTGWEALCWVIKFSEEPVISASAVEKVTGIAEHELAEAWQTYDVQRYARRYKRRLAGGNGVPLALEKVS